MKPVFALLLASLLLTPFGYAGAPRVERMTYVTDAYYPSLVFHGLGEATPLCRFSVEGDVAPVPPTEVSTPAAAGDVCFVAKPGETQVTVSVEDLSGLPVYSKLAWNGGSGWTGFTAFCGSVTVAIPAGAYELRVDADADLTLTACPGGVTSTAGTVTAAFT